LVGGTSVSPSIDVLVKNSAPCDVSRSCWAMNHTPSPSIASWP
jgi:hypothetical protein